jgi:hypothetical protein
VALGGGTREVNGELTDCLEDCGEQVFGESILECTLLVTSESCAHCAADDDVFWGLPEDVVSSHDCEDVVVVCVRVCVCVVVSGCVCCSW